MSGQVEWQGDHEFGRIITDLSHGLTDFHLMVETEAKRNLFPGHGKVTGTLQRSTHAAGPRYNYRQDHVKPANNSPNRSGSGGGPAVVGKLILRYRVGSGMKYAKAMEDKYKFLSKGYDRVSPRATIIITKYSRRG